MPDSFAFYRYDPSLVAAIVAIVLFVLSTGVHTFHLVRTRTWYLIPLAIGGYFEWIGYVGRAWSSQQSPDFTQGPFIMQALLLLLAPALFAASIYMELGRIIQLTEGEHHALLKRRWLTKVFVTGDVVSFLVQGGGGALLAGDSSTSRDLGQTLIVVALFIQLAFFGFFVVVAGLYDYRIQRSPTHYTANNDRTWHKHLVILYVTSGLILVRSVFRIIEYLQGNDGYIMSHEAFLYVFDALLMLTVMVMSNIVHPSEIKSLLKGGKYVRNGWKLAEWKKMSDGEQIA